MLIQSLNFLILWLFDSIYFTLGKSSKVWNGGGDDTVHSSVVAPSPHGFCCAVLFFIKAWSKFNKNTAKPTIEIYEPIDDM